MTLVSFRSIKLIDTFWLSIRDLRLLVKFTVAEITWNMWPGFFSRRYPLLIGNNLLKLILCHMSRLESAWMKKKKKLNNHRFSIPIKCSFFCILSAYHCYWFPSFDCTLWWICFFCFHNNSHYWSSCFNYLS